MPGLASEIRWIERMGLAHQTPRVELEEAVDGPRVVSGGASWRRLPTPEQMFRVIIHGWERGMRARWGTLGALKLSRFPLKTLFVPSCKTKDALRYWVTSKQRAREWKGGRSALLTLEAKAPVKQRGTEGKRCSEGRVSAVSDTLGSTERWQRCETRERNGTTSRKVSVPCRRAKSGRKGCKRVDTKKNRKREIEKERKRAKRLESPRWSPFRKGTATVTGC